MTDVPLESEIPTLLKDAANVINLNALEKEIVDDESCG
jgi:hypothetical protein